MVSLMINHLSLVMRHVAFTIPVSVNFLLYPIQSYCRFPVGFLLYNIFGCCRFSIELFFVCQAFPCLPCFSMIWCVIFQWNFYIQWNFSIHWIIIQYELNKVYFTMCCPLSNQCKFCFQILCGQKKRKGRSCCFV